MSAGPAVTRTAVVTGAGQGIGREIARVLGAAGLRVALLDLNEGAAQSAAQSLRDDGAQAHAWGVDVGDDAAVAATFREVAQTLGPVGVLVNNAAIFSSLTRKPFEEIPAAEWDAVMRVNVSGAFFAAKAASPQMRAQGWGRILSISSNTVDLGRPNFLHYVTSKAAIVGMTRSMARELGPHGITVNAIMPTLTRTNVPTQVVSEATFREVAALQSIPRSGEPIDVARTIRFLASDDAAFITGQTIAVDGGAIFR